VGIKVGHLPSQPPFSLTVTHSRRNSTNGLAKRSSQKISKADFLSSIEDREAFYDLYVSITNRAIDLYAKGGRRKFALKLHGTLAALDVCVPANRFPVKSQLFIFLFEVTADAFLLLCRHTHHYPPTMHRTCGVLWNHSCYHGPLIPMLSCKGRRTESGYTFYFHS
jgi:hypothetical protein